MPYCIKEFLGCSDKTMISKSSKTKLVATNSCFSHDGLQLGPLLAEKFSCRDTAPYPVRLRRRGHVLCHALPSPMPMILTKTWGEVLVYCYL